jgi:hypothetical protein
MNNVNDFIHWLATLEYTLLLDELENHRKGVGCGVFNTVDPAVIASDPQLFVRLDDEEEEHLTLLYSTQSTTLKWSHFFEDERRKAKEPHHD